MVFNVIYVAALNGLDYNGNDYIYSVLKWNQEPAASAGFAAGSVLVGILCHLIFWGFSKLRDYIWSKNFVAPLDENENRHIDVSQANSNNKMNHEMSEYFYM